MQQMKKQPRLFWLLITNAVLMLIFSFAGFDRIANILLWVGLFLFPIYWIQMFFYVKNANKVASRFYKIKLRDVFKKKE
jgi:hypothetical protein